MLSLRIQHFLSGMDLILCNLFADLHPLLKKFHHLIVNFIYFRLHSCKSVILFSLQFLYLIMQIQLLHTSISTMYCHYCSLRDQ